MDPLERYDEICDDLAARDPRIELDQMMGMPCIKADGKLIAGFSRWNGPGMVFRLPDEDARAEALALEGAALFDPGSGRKAPFKDWVQVPPAHADRWPELANTALRLRPG